MKAKGFSIARVLVVSLAVLLGISAPLLAEQENGDGALVILDKDPTADRIISFGETKDGKLDVKIEGYSGMTEAAKDFIGLLRKNYPCDCSK